MCLDVFVGSRTGVGWLVVGFEKWRSSEETMFSSSLSKALCCLGERVGCILRRQSFPLAFLGLKLSPSFLSNNRREVNEEEKCEEKILSSCRCKERINLRF
jgi:hypothetical protein